MRNPARLVLTVAALAGCSPAPKAAPASSSSSALPAVTDQVSAAALTAFAPLPASMPSPDNPMTAAKVNLGRRLYYETLLSRSHDVSCNSCHGLNAYGADGRRFSLGDEGQPGGRNAPSVYNAAGHVAQFWDGRAPTVEEQAKGPILNPAEMGMPAPDAVLAHLRSDPSYVAMFRAAFPGEPNPVSYDNLGRAIGAFERGLVTPSRFDRFLEGDRTALTAEERIGLNTFVAAGCVGCHNGAFVGGRIYNRLGVAAPWPNQADQGRAGVTRRPADSMVFKVASLRNVAMTAPYFHDGSVNDLPEAVRLMGRYQLGRELTTSEISAIVAYLKTLTGVIPTEYIAYPSRPN